MITLSKRNMAKAFLAIPVTGFHHIYAFARDYESEEPVAERFLRSLFSGSFDRRSDNFFMTVTGLFELILCNLVFGFLLCHHLHVNGIYVFTRQKSRIGWFFQQTGELFLYIFIYITLYLGIVFSLAVKSSASPVDETAVFIFVTTFIILTLFTFLTTLLINLLSVRFGSNFGFILVYFGVAVFTGLALIHEKISFLRAHPMLLKLNPMANTIVNWDLSGVNTWFSIGYFIVLNGAVFVAGTVYISRLDIGIVDRESNQ